MSASPSRQLDTEQAAWIQGSVSIIVGSRDARLHPHLMRALGCRVAADRSSVTVLMSAASSGQVLDDLRDNGAIAVVFTEPSTNRALQLKGTIVAIDACTGADLLLAERYLHSFIDELGQIGFGAEVARNVLAHEGDLLAVEFGVAAAFEQTPGPQAGHPLPAAG